MACQKPRKAVGLGPDGNHLEVALFLSTTNQQTCQDSSTLLVRDGLRDEMGQEKKPIISGFFFSTVRELNCGWALCRVWSLVR